MKTLILTIAVLISLNAAATDRSMVGEPEVPFTLIQSVPQLETVNRQVERQYLDLLAATQADRGRPSHAGRVLIVPAKQTAVKELLTTMEDMSVMSRIFDKKLGKESYLNPGAFYVMPTWSRNRRITEGIYLEGYGALFLTSVDFPLSPPAEANEPETVEDFDLIWEQTKREVYTPQYMPENRANSMPHLRGSSVTQFRSIQLEKTEYDAEKVEELKRKLIKTLKHAANIRNLQAEESIIVTVIGKDQARTIIVHGERTQERGASRELDSSSSSVLTIRAEKSAVDEFAEGKIDFEKFRQKVQIFTY